MLYIQRQVLLEFYKSNEGFKGNVPFNFLKTVCAYNCAHAHSLEGTLFKGPTADSLSTSPPKPCCAPTEWEGKRTGPTRKRWRGEGGREGIDQMRHLPNPPSDVLLVGIEF